jgi:hypothetical protein
MGLTRTDWRTLKIAAVTLVPVEIAALRVLDSIPFDVEPLTKPTALESAIGVVVVVLHWPAIFIAASTLVRFKTFLWSALFLNGYVLMFGALFAVLYLHRAIRRLTSPL